MPTLSTSTPSRAKPPASAAAPRPGGYAGKLLRVNLTTGKIWSEPWSPEDMRELIGGVGLGARIFYREVPAHVHWDHPENRRSEEHTSELQSRPHLVCRLLLEKKKTTCPG